MAEIDIQVFIDCMTDVIPEHNLKNVLYVAKDRDRLNCVCCEKVLAPGSDHADNCPIGLLAKHLENTRKEIDEALKPLERLSEKRKREEN